MGHITWDELGKDFGQARQFLLAFTEAEITFNAASHVRRFVSKESPEKIEELHRAIPTLLKARLQPSEQSPFKGLPEQQQQWGAEIHSYISHSLPDNNALAAVATDGGQVNEHYGTETVVNEAELLRRLNTDLLAKVKQLETWVECKAAQLNGLIADYESRLSKLQIRESIDDAFTLNAVPTRRPRAPFLIEPACNCDLIKDEMKSERIRVLEALEAERYKWRLEEKTLLAELQHERSERHFLEVKLLAVAEKHTNEHLEWKDEESLLHEKINDAITTKCANSEWIDEERLLLDQITRLRLACAGQAAAVQKAESEKDVMQDLLTCTVENMTVLQESMKS